MIGWLTSLFNRSKCVDTLTRKSRVYLSDEDKLYVEAAYKQGVARSQIAKDFKVSYSTVLRITKDSE